MPSEDAHLCKDFLVHEDLLVRHAKELSFTLLLLLTRFLILQVSPDSLGQFLFFLLSIFNWLLHANRWVVLALSCHRMNQLDSRLNLKLTHLKLSQVSILDSFELSV